MSIKNLFNDLKKLGRKKYFSRNGEEEVYFIRKNLEIEIIYVNGCIDLIINQNGSRDNYLKSESLSAECKHNIESILDSYDNLEVKCSRISKILVQTFKTG